MMLRENGKRGVTGIFGNFASENIDALSVGGNPEG
jgi:hypothetical protein